MAKPLDFLHKNNNQDEWAKRYIGSNIQMQWIKYQCKISHLVNILYTIKIG